MKKVPDPADQKSMDPGPHPCLVTVPLTPSPHVKSGNSPCKYLNRAHPPGNASDIYIYNTSNICVFIKDLFAMVAVCTDSLCKIQYLT